MQSPSIMLNLIRRKTLELLEESMLWKRLNPGDKNVVTFLFLERWKQLDFGTSHALNFRSQNYLKKVLKLGQKIP